MKRIYVKFEIKMETIMRLYIKDVEIEMISPAKHFNRIRIKDFP